MNFERIGFVVADDSDEPLFLVGDGPSCFFWVPVPWLAHVFPHREAAAGAAMQIVDAGWPRLPYVLEFASADDEYIVLADQEWGGPDWLDSEFPSRYGKSLH